MEYVVYAVGGLSIFMMGLNTMRKGIEDIFINKASSFIIKYTKYKSIAFLLGILLTMIMNSSAGLTAIVITLVSCKVLTIDKGMMLIIGSNVGTCFTSYLFTFDISQYSLLIIFVGFIISLFHKSKLKLIGNIVIGLGLIFLGLDFLSNGLEVISTSIWFQNILLYTTNPLLGLLISSLLTALVQSSSMLIVITQNLYSLTSITLQQGIIIMLGANIGTCFTGMIAGINSSSEAKKTALCNLIFNVIGAIIFIIILIPFTKVMSFIELSYFTSNSKLTISTAHMLFNVVSSILGVIFLKQLLRIVRINFDS